MVAVAILLPVVVSLAIPVILVGASVYAGYNTVRHVRRAVRR